MDRITRNAAGWRVSDRMGTPTRYFTTEADARAWLADEPRRDAAKRASGIYQPREG